MTSELSDRDQAEDRGAVSGSAAALRRLSDYEARLAEQSDLPMIREKHRVAAERWAQLAADRERLDRTAARRSAAEPHD